MNRPINTAGVSTPEQEESDTSSPSELPLPSSTSDNQSPPEIRNAPTKSSIPSTVTVPTKRPKAKAKHKKPQGMPRRPLSAYNFFYKAERVKWLEEQKELKKEAPPSSASNGDTKKSDFLEMGKAISQRWRMLTNEAREPYEKEAKQDLVRYHREMDAFNMNLVRSYKGPEKPDSAASKPVASSRQEVSTLRESVERRSEPSVPSSIQDGTATQIEGPSLVHSLQLLLPLLQLQQAGTTRTEPSAPFTQQPVSVPNVLHALFRQVIEQRLADERLAEVRALLAELQQILVMQIQLQQHIQRQQAQPVVQSAVPEEGLNEACSALLSLVNQLK